MEFIIKNPKPSQSLIDKNEIVLKLYYKKVIKLILIRYLVGAFLLFLGILDARTTNYNYPLIESIAIVFLLFNTANVWAYKKQRDKFRLQVSALVNKLSKYADAVETRINDESVVSSSSLYQTQMKWQAFFSYSHYKDFLFFNETPDDLHSSITVDSRLMSEPDFSALLAFVKQKLPERKL